MKKTIFYLLASVSVCAASFLGISDKSAPIDNSKINWYTIEEALAAHEEHPKKLFIDMYTDWCGWCKVMDKKTFTNEEVIKMINSNYYPVKFNAEQRAPVQFKGKTYEFIPGGRNGIHAWAYETLNRQASYPSFVVLDENLNRAGIIKGYKTPEQFTLEMQVHNTL